jgi:hypothetical protein
MTKAEAIRLGQINSQITRLQNLLALARADRRYLMKVVNKRKVRNGSPKRPLVPYAGREVVT